MPPLQGLGVSENFREQLGNTGCWDQVLPQQQQGLGTSSTALPGRNGSAGEVAQLRHEPTPRWTLAPRAGGSACGASCWPQGLHISLEALFLLHPDILMSSISCNCEYFWNYMSLFSEGFFSDPCVTWTCPAPLGIPKLACWPPVYFWDLRVRGSSTGLHETPRQGGRGLGRRGWAGETLTPRVWKLKSPGHGASCRVLPAHSQPPACNPTQQ